MVQPGYLIYMNVMWTADIWMKWRCDHRGCDCKVTKKNVFGASTGFEPIASVLALQCSTNWAMKTHTLGAGQFGEFIVPVKGMRYINIMWTADIRIKWKKVLTSNSWIILESRNSESFSLSGPHILGHLCIKTKFLGIFLSTLNVSILKRSLRRSSCKMPKFFVTSVNVFCVGNNSEIKLCKFYFHAHLLYFYMANWLSTWWNFKKTFQLKYCG